MKKNRWQRIGTALVALVLCLGFIGCNAGSAVRYSFPNLIPMSEAESAPARPINQNDVPLAGFTIQKEDIDSQRMQLAELLQITSAQFARPIFNNNVWSDVQDSYYAAVQVLNRYIKNDWNDGEHDFEKILTIHDYLASEIEYDYELYERSLTNGVTDEDASAFEITGVFLQKKAVCDGLSKAFVLLCAIEGIEARYVRGSYTDAYGTTLHAWNKVKLDGVWYNVDVTLDNFLFRVNNKSIEVLNHGYFLRSDRMMFGVGGHEEDTSIDDIYNAESLYPPMPASGADDWGYYADRTVSGLSTSKMTVYSPQELKAVFEEVKKSKNPRVGAVELRLDFTGGGEPSNDVADYAQAIEDAYRAAGMSSLSYTANMENPPFVLYPDGIFVFLIYA